MKIDKVSNSIKQFLNYTGSSFIAIATRFTLTQR